jgi:hypothetical protein
METEFGAENSGNRAESTRAVNVELDTPTIVTVNPTRFSCGIQRSIIASVQSVLNLAGCRKSDVTCIYFFLLFTFQPESYACGPVDSAHSLHWQRGD